MFAGLVSLPDDDSAGRPLPREDDDDDREILLPTDNRS